MNSLTNCSPIIGKIGRASLVYAGTKWHTRWCSIVNSGAPTVLHYYYPFKDIKEEVHKLSSYLGKYRATEDTAHLLDAIEVSDDEDDLMARYVPSAMADVFDLICDLTDRIDNAYLYDEGTPELVWGTATEIKEGEWVSNGEDLYVALVDIDDLSTVSITDTDYFEPQTIDYRHSIHYVIELPIWLNRNMIKPIDISLFNAIVYHIMYEWLEISYTDEAEHWLAKYNHEIELIRDRANKMRHNQFCDIIPRPF